MFITNGTWAHVVLLFARSTDAPGHKGVSAFLVPTDTPGLTRRTVHGKLGLRGQATAELVLEDVPRPPPRCSRPRARASRWSTGAVASANADVGPPAAST
ncbi:acyl-CoA dehydrogenase family protein [Streptomyces violaceorubidus]